MLIPERKILFVHVPKTAGQSMENALLSALGKSRKSAGADYLLRKNPDPTKGPVRLAHLTAQDYTKYGYLSADQFETAFSFSFVRDPWDRVVSFYKYSGLAALISFNVFVLQYLPRLVKQEYWFYRPQVDFLHDTDGNLLVDFVGRFEYLTRDWTKLNERCDLKLGALPRDNTTSSPRFWSRKNLRWIWKYPGLLTHLNLSNKEYSDYRQYYNSELEKAVAELYRADIETFDYKFNTAGS